MLTSTYQTYTCLSAPEPYKASQNTCYQCTKTSDPRSWQSIRGSLCSGSGRQSGCRLGPLSQSSRIGRAIPCTGRTFDPSRGTISDCKAGGPFLTLFGRRPLCWLGGRCWLGRRAWRCWRWKGSWIRCRLARWGRGRLGRLAVMLWWWVAIRSLPKKLDRAELSLE